jgi:17beta-estradiol 17-dehydrogenase / very-long-chain 3-oxoacyl-CoA reductase
MTKLRHPSMSAPSAEAFVRVTLSSIGQSGGAQGRSYEMTPYWFHALFDYFCGMGGAATEKFRMRLIGNNLAQMREKSMRRRAREAANRKLESGA